MSTPVKTNTSIYTTAFTSYSNETSAMKMGYIHQQFKQVALSIEIAPVFKNMAGKQPSQGEKVYNYDAAQFVTLTQSHAAELMSAIVAVRSGSSTEVKVNMGAKGDRFIGVSKASFFEGIAKPDNGYVLFVTSGQIEVIHFIETNSVADLNIEYMLRTGYREVTCGAGSFIAQVTQNLTKSRSSTTSNIANAVETSSRRVNVADSSVTTEQADLLRNFSNASSGQSMSLPGDDTPTNF